MLSPEILSDNLDALTHAQGICPALGPLPGTMRVAISGNCVNVELRTGAGDWRAIDTSEGPEAGAHWLDDNLPALRALQDRVIVIATDTTLGPLLSGGVRPDIVVGTDSSELNARHLTTPVQTHDVMLAAEGSLHPSAIERFSGRIFSLRIADHDPWPWLRGAGRTNRAAGS